MYDIKSLFGKKVRELRKKKKLTQEELAELVEIDPRNLLKIENGQTFPRTQTLQKIMDVFGSIPEEMFSFEYLDDIKLIRKKIIKKINEDENLARLVYKLIK